MSEQIVEASCGQEKTASPNPLEAHSQAALKVATFPPGLRRLAGGSFTQYVQGINQQLLATHTGFLKSPKPKELRAFRAASKFLVARLKSLGLDAPRIELILGGGIADSDGSGMALARSAFVSPAKALSDSPRSTRYRSLWVHELSHASGHIQVTRTNLLPTGFFVPRQGVTVANPHTRRTYFMLFEEYAATANQLAFASAHGVKETSFSHEFALSRETKTALEKSVLELLDTMYLGLGAHLEQSGTGPALLRPLAVEDDLTAFSLRSITQVYGNRKSVCIHNSTVLALDTIAAELFPALSPSAAAKVFRDRTCRVQMGAPHSLISRPIRKKLGKESLLFLASLPTASEGWFAPLLVAMFADAGRLPHEKCQEIRSRICKAAKGLGLTA